MAETAKDQKVQTGEDLANEALASVTADIKNELATSDKIAETLGALQVVIERNANEISNVDKELKEKREMLKSIMENDQELAEAEAEAKKNNEKAKQRKANLGADPQAVSLKMQIAELSQNKKEIEESLSSHLVNYHQLTGSTSFDTSDGDQWEFLIRARVKTRK